MAFDSLRETLADFVRFMKDKREPLSKKIALSWVLTIVPTMAGLFFWVLFKLGGFVLITVALLVMFTAWAVHELGL